jgi:DNA polymerase/3'-5' exonuclease PolX
MSTGAKTPYSAALAKAERLLTFLQPVCERIEIAGSLRRQKGEIGDIELVAIPRRTLVLDMFGQANGYTCQVAALLEREGIPRVKQGRKVDGERLKGFEWEGMGVDLFLCEQATWAMCLLIRTGSKAYSQWFMTPRRKGGALPSGMRVTDQRLYQHDEPVEGIVEERDLYVAVNHARHAQNALLIRYHKPENRSEQIWKVQR